MEISMYILRLLEFVFLGAGSWFDIKRRVIPMYLFVVFGFLAIFCNFIWKYQSLENVFLGCVPGIVLLIIGTLTKETIGFGDGLGCLVLGLFEGWKGNVLVIFFAMILSGVYGVWQMIFLKESWESRIPFFPFLFFGMLGVVVL